MDPLQIRLLLVENHRADAARILYTAFRRKLFPLLHNPMQVQKLISMSLDPAYLVTAVSGDTLLGVAGLDIRGKTFCRPTVQDCIQHLGFWNGLVGWIVLNLFTKGTCPKTDLRISVLAVDEQFRGQGIGTRLIQHVLEFAKVNDFLAVRLEVVDTNPSAKRLYERLGFKAVRSIHLGIFKSWLGFSAEIEMIHKL